MSVSTPINVGSALRTCKLNTNLRYSAMMDRLFNPSSVICPVPTGLDQYGRPAGCLLNSLHQVPGCISPLDRIAQENAQRPNYVGYIPALMNNPELTGVGNAGCDNNNIRPNVCSIINNNATNLAAANAGIGINSPLNVPYNLGSMLSNSSSINCGYEISMAQQNPAYAAALASSGSPCAQYVNTFAGYQPPSSMRNSGNGNGGGRLRSGRF